MDQQEDRYITFAFENAIHSAKTCDVTVVVGSVKYRVHKRILSQSKILNAIFYGSSDAEEPLPNLDSIELNVLATSVKFVRDFFNYLYTGSISVSSHSLDPLVYLASKYSVKGLLERCLEYIETSVYEKGDLPFIIRCWKTLQRIRNVEVKDICYRVENFIKNLVSWNMEFVLREGYYRSLELGEWKALLSSPYLVVSDEITLLKAVLSWVQTEHQGHELIYLLKFPMLSVEDLVLFERGAHQYSQEVQAIAKLKLAEAYKFHAVDFNRRKVLQFSSAISPRLYRRSFCLPYRQFKSPGTFDIDTAEMTENFQVPMSLSNSDNHRYSQWEATVKIMGTGVEASPCLRIKRIGGEMLPMFTEACVCILEKVSGSLIIRQVLTASFNLEAKNNDTQMLHVNHLVPYKELVSDDSSYKVTLNGRTVTLAMDIILVPV